jgi:DNA-binding SARP family transcriptional activator
VTELRLLGPVELRVDGRVLDIGPPKRRAVFAALAVDAGRPVAVDTVVDRVWDQVPPAQARSTLYAHILQIRRTLAEAATANGDSLRLVRRSGGYLLDVTPDIVDLHRFRELTGRARAERDDAERARLLGEALSLWRGTPLAGLPDVAWVSQVRESCRQLRLDAVRAWAQAELRLGHHEAVAGALFDVVSEYPLVEPLTAALIRALYALGRVADALACYTAIRRRLADELGIDPGPELQQLHQAILRGELDQPVAAPALPVMPMQHLPIPQRSRARRPRTILVVSIAATVIAATAAGTAWMFTERGKHPAQVRAAATWRGLPTGWVRIRPVTAPGLCLADGRVRDHRYTPLVAVQLSCDRIAPLSTLLEPTGGDTYRIQWHHPDYGKGCLKAWTGPGPQSGLLEPMDDCEQGSRFHIEPSGPPGAGTYVLRVDNQGCVGIKDADTAEGTEALMGHCVEDGQVFAIEPAS